MRGTASALRYSGAGVFFAGAAVLTLLAGITVFSFLRSVVKTETVLELARDLPAGTTLTAQDVVARSIPLGGAPRGALRDRSQVVGQRLKHGMVAGAYLQAGHLVAKGSDLANQVASLGRELRATMLPGELVPAPDRLVAGDWLELTGVFPFVDPESQEQTQITLPLGRVQVLDIPQGRGESSKQVVLVATSPEQESMLALTMRAGNLRIAVLGHGVTTPPAPPYRLDRMVNNWGVQAGPDPTGQEGTAPAATGASGPPDSPGPGQAAEGTTATGTGTKGTWAGTGR